MQWICSLNSTIGINFLFAPRSYSQADRGSPGKREKRILGHYVAARNHKRFWSWGWGVPVWVVTCLLLWKEVAHGHKALKKASVLWSNMEVGKDYVFGTQGAEWAHSIPSFKDCAQVWSNHLGFVCGWGQGCGHKPMCSSDCWSQVFCLYTVYKW